MEPKSKYVEGKLLAEGKTKRIIEVVENPNLVIIENKEDITAHDDPGFTKKFASKAVCATTTTCRVSELLNKLGIPTAFVEQLSEAKPKVKFVAKKSSMISLEVVVRRYAVGSYLKREPSLVQEPPFRFEEPVIEFFLKTTKGALVINGETVIDGLNPKLGEEDPLIGNPFDSEWILLHAKKPVADPESNLSRKIDKQVMASKVLPFSDKVASDVTMGQIRDIALCTFIALENAFKRIGVRFIDFKIELGVDVETGFIVIADVIDNDSWRIRDENWQELSKERFRQGESLDVVEQLYQLVAELVSRPEFLGEVA